MMAFDVRTAFMLVGLLYLLLPTVTWTLLTGWKSRQVSLWCSGGLLIGCSLLLVAMTGKFAEWATVSLAMLVYLISLFVYIQSLRLDLGIPWRKRWIAAAVIVIFLIFEWFHLGLQNFSLRVQFNFGVTAGLLLYLASLAWRIGREEQSLSAKWIACVYGLSAVTLLFRVFSVMGSDRVTNLLNEGLSSQLITLASLFSNVIGHFGYIGLALDRSMRRELKAAAELARDEEGRRLGKQIAHLDRQRAIGELAASLGHELNQPLTAILTNTQVAKRGIQSGRFDDTQLTEFLDKIVYNTWRARQIIERIRCFIRPSKSSSEPVNLNLIVFEVAELVVSEARSHNITFGFSPSIRVVQVSGDPIQLSQIVLNVFRNAIEALTLVQRREIHVSCICREGRAILSVCDTGPGIAPEAIGKVGKAFYTTKTNGLGLGLSISRSIASQYGGTLSITNANAEDGGGTRVELNLPALPEEKR
jgi:signal transduction histidine kinase